MSATTAALVVHYSSSPGAPLRRVVEPVQHELASCLGDRFVPRDPATVHATLLGLDDTPEPRHAVLGALARDELAREPLVLQVGGWPDTDLAVSSRRRRLHERTLSRHDATLVLLGWPVDDAGAPTLRLDRVRRDLVAAGGRHRYPLDDRHLDPDAHLVVGSLAHEPADPASDPALDRALDRVRAALARTPRRLAVGPDDLVRVTYDDPALPTAFTRVDRPWEPSTP